MQRLSEPYQHNINADVYDEGTLKTCEEIDMQTQHKPYTSESLNLQMKFGGTKLHHNERNQQTSEAHNGYAQGFSDRLKPRNLSDNRDNRKAQADLNDIRNSLISQNGFRFYKNGNAETITRNGNVINNSKSSDTLTPMTPVLLNGTTKHWKNISKRITLHENHTPKISPDESDSNDTDILNSERNAGVHYKTSSRTDSISKNSSRSFNDESYYEGMSTESALLSKKSSTMLLDTIASPPLKAITSETRFRRVTSKSNWPQESEINFIMLVGLLFTIALSKILQYSQAYCAWFMGQVLHLRYMFLAPNVSIWELCNFDDTSRYGLRTKLLLLPLVATCSLLYGLSSVLHSTLRCLLTQAPNSIIVFIQNLINP
uniref:Uncharacterized protein n=1 Tax=Bactrocera latifrons TaxID=174628 RepID=A0A0K8U842_BACLA